MTYDPRDDIRRRDETADAGDVRQEESPTLVVPLLIAIALLIGVAYYFFGGWGASFPHVRSTDGSAVTKSEPSPN
jgi:hypothetical protein